jgi:hypothetical protein
VIHPLPVQSTSSNQAWKVTRSHSVTPLIPLGISIWMCFVPLLSDSLFNNGTRLFALSVELLSLTGSRENLSTESYPAARRAAADLHHASFPRNRSSHFAASSNRQAFSCGSSRLPPTLTILFFNHLSCLVAAAQLNLLDPSCSSSTGPV